MGYQRVVKRKNYIPVREVLRNPIAMISRPARMLLDEARAIIPFDPTIERTPVKQIVEVLEDRFKFKHFMGILDSVRFFETVIVFTNTEESKVWLLDELADNNIYCNFEMDKNDTELNIVLTEFPPSKANVMCYNKVIFYEKPISFGEYQACIQDSYCREAVKMVLTYMTPNGKKQAGRYIQIFEEHGQLVPDSLRRMCTL